MTNCADSFFGSRMERLIFWRDIHSVEIHGQKTSPSRRSLRTSLRKRLPLKSSFRETSLIQFRLTHYRVPLQKGKRSRIGAPRGQETFATQTTVHCPPCLRPQAGFCSPPSGGRRLTPQKEMALHSVEAPNTTGDVRNPRLRSIARRVFRRRTGFALHPPVETPPPVKRMKSVSNKGPQKKSAPSGRERRRHFQELSLT
jgi:hypothetical protein